MKEKNKSLLINSLISVSMCVMPFSVMAAGSMEQGEKLETTVKVINAEQNVEYPETDNTKALHTSNKDEIYRVREYNENFIFLDTNGQPINTDGTDKKVEYNSAVGYKLTSSDSVTDTGFVVGHKEVEDAGPTNQKERFFRYWNPSASSVSTNPLKDYSKDPQFSPSFPKLCYRVNGKYPSVKYSTENEIKNGEITNPLIRIATKGGDSAPSINRIMKYGGPKDFIVPVIPVTNKDEITKKGITDAIWTNITDNTLTCNTEKDGCTLTWDNINKCMRINKYGELKSADSNNSTTGYSYTNPLNRTPTLVNCATGTTNKDGNDCGTYDVKSLTGDSTTNKAYRISQFVKLDISGNDDLIEIPQQTCYKCLGVETKGVEDTSCAHIVDEVFKKKGGDCAQTVAALATKPRIVKETLPESLNSSTNCKSCLCKIEGLLKAKGCK